MRTLGMLAVVGGLVTSGMALAQTPAPLPRPASPALDKAGDVPDSQKLERSTQALGTMRESLRQVFEKVEEARRTKDVVKLNCANEKLTQIKGLLRISEQADVALQEAVSKSEAAPGEHEFTKVMIAQQKVGQLRSEAEECIGQLAFRTDENLFVEVEEPDNLPGGDPTRPPPPPDLIVRPPPASPVD
ncbi:hypothetical protein D7X55_02895 [Corallococcus sp. AB049A]|uniref:hypothetical protein n=1 Tax=Corallococcus sp. AB049A TaxID=2316721 RepID=UPI000EA01169|nr:hypothetical protein [Corallococcus sp. AB049A]RKH42467.1 hypothetical protein D7Y23_31265 [Corallococcus sp. AB050B]RKI74221.1 hypothetical protein D7X55_02895 [Corallococcus sp. AB049A]